MIKIKQQKIGFRVDGGSDIGMGHMMRCLALAQAFPNHVDISFITKKKSSIVNLLEEYKFEAIYIDNDLEYNEEIKQVKDLISDNNFSILITDSYEFKQDYLIQIKKSVDKLVTIHDFAPFAFPSDIVINGNIYAPELDYESLTGDTEFLLGTNYTLMRKEFKNLPNREINKEVNNILVTVGGSDSLNLTPKILKSLNQLEDESLHVDVVIGSAFDNIFKIIQEVKNTNMEINLHFNVNKMSKLMLECDLAISAGGTTLYELAATGTPTITLLQAENQVLVAEAMEEEGVIQNLGFGNKVNIKKITEGINCIINNFKARCNMSQQGQNLIDGLGCKRCLKNCINFDIIKGENL